MRRKISLYIADQLVDLNDQSLILFNYTMEDLNNPTIVKNSYSQQITLPGTPNNNRIMESFFRLDRITGNGFNPLVKTPFKIYNEMSEVLESGYIKLDKVDRQRGGICSYSVSLFGGLGGFFYNLSFNEDGSKRTLADLSYKIGDAIVDPKNQSLYIDKSEVKDAWDNLAGTSSTPIYSLLNFAPAYNGLPSCHFGADKGILKNNGASIYNPPGINFTDGDYQPMDGANNSILLEFENNHTEWETQDLRSYLQRPVISLAGLMEAFTLSANSGNYTFVISREITDQGNPWYNKGWMTLPMFDRDNLDPTDCKMSDILSGTDTPADYLIGFAKMFGLVFIVDSATNTITLSKRNEFFGDMDVVDISRRIDSTMEVKPYGVDTKHYIWDEETSGEYADDYASRYGRTYGAKWVNTGYDFNSEQKKVLSNFPFKGAADVIETSPAFLVYGGNSDDQIGSYLSYFIKFGLMEQMSWKLYRTNVDGDLTSIDKTMSNNWIAPFLYAAGSNYEDVFAKVQLHSDGNKADNGSNVLLFFDGFKALPVYRQGQSVIASVDFHLSDDTNEMLLLNDGTPCWEMTTFGSNVINLTSLPQFRRWTFNAIGVLKYTWDFGDPLEVATHDTLIPGKNIFDNWWKNYISDRYDVDAKIVRCKVNLSGFQVNGSLLRRLFYFDGCIWSLNKIINHSLTTYDLTECEFVKVKDEQNYRNGQITF